MVILQDPSLLLVDEPVAGMTDKETEQTGRLLQSLAEKHAIVVIEHDMEFVRQIARIVTVLHEGTVICEGTVDKVQSDERVREIYLGRQKVTHACKMLKRVQLRSRIAQGLDVRVRGRLAPGLGGENAPFEHPISHSMNRQC